MRCGNGSSGPPRKTSENCCRAGPGASLSETSTSSTSKAGSAGAAIRKRSPRCREKSAAVRRSSIRGGYRRVHDGLGALVCRVHLAIVWSAADLRRQRSSKALRAAPTVTAFLNREVADLPMHGGRAGVCCVGRGGLPEGARRAKRVSIHVEKNNPALRLYARLGFVSVGDRGVYLLMGGDTMSDTAARTLDRRRFIQLAGAGAAVAVAGPLVSNARAASGILLKVGVMVPTGSSYATMGKSLVDGLAMGFDDARSCATPVSATIMQRDVDRGFGGARATAQTLLDDGADVVVAGISALTAARIGDLFSTRQAPLVVADVGAHVVQPAAKSAYVLYNSLLYWQASFSAAQWAAANFGKKAFVAASMCDSGYDTIYAFRRGFEAAGGTVVGDAVTHVNPADAGLSE